MLRPEAGEYVFMFLRSKLAKSRGLQCYNEKLIQIRIETTDYLVSIFFWRRPQTESISLTLLILLNNFTFSLPLNLIGFNESRCSRSILNWTVKGEMKEEITRRSIWEIDLYFLSSVCQNPGFRPNFAWLSWNNRYNCPIGWMLDYNILLVSCYNK